MPCHCPKAQKMRLAASSSPFFTLRWGRRAWSRKTGGKKKNKKIEACSANVLFSYTLI